jgi:hypothetical protein
MSLRNTASEKLRYVGLNFLRYRCSAWLTGANHLFTIYAVPVLFSFLQLQCVNSILRSRQFLNIGNTIPVSLQVHTYIHKSSADTLGIQL